MTSSGSLRAMLFIPGTAEDKFKKIPSFASGSFILDLEDSVPPAEKERGRHLVANLIDTIGEDYTLHVRVNATTSQDLVADLTAVVRPGLSGIVIPKVERPGELEEVDALIEALATAKGFDPKSLDITAAIETAAGVHSVYEIAAVGGLLTRLSFGSGDFALDLGLEWPDEDGVPEVMLLAKSQLVLASRVAGLQQPHDGAYSRYRDLEGLAQEARQSRRLGFSGKHVVHPSQIPVVEAIFRPTVKQIERAQRLVEAFETAERSGAGAIGVDGELVDYPIIYRARKLLDEAQQ